MFIKRSHPAMLGLLTCLFLWQPLRAADAPFEKEIRAFEQADRDHPPPQNAVLFLGSSTIRIWTTLPQDFPDVPVINRGFGGSQIADSLRYADRIVIPDHPKRIIFYAGDNDLAAGKSPQQVLEDFQALVKKVQGALPNVTISFISIKPSLARWKLIDKIKEANQLIENFTKEHKNVRFINVFPLLLGPDGKPRKDLLRPDGLHMSRKGYEMWIPLIRADIERP